MALFSREFEEHRRYLADEVRLDAFRRALAEVIHPDSVVLDIGAGTGILALLAARAGARRVFAVEQSGIATLAEKIIAANRLSAAVSVIHGSSLDISLPAAADVVVTDLIGRFGFDVGIGTVLADASRRHLKPGGTLIPEVLAIRVAPAESAAMWNSIECDRLQPCDFDFRVAHEAAANAAYAFRESRDSIIGTPSCLLPLDVRKPVSTVQIEYASEIGRDGIVHGLAGWFEARLSSSVQLTNSPFADRRSNRANVFFPLLKPLVVRQGAQVRVTMHLRPLDQIVSWAVSDSADSGRSPMQSTFIRDALLDGRRHVP